MWIATASAWSLRDGEQRRGHEVIRSEQNHISVASRRQSSHDTSIPDISIHDCPERAGRFAGQLAAVERRVDHGARLGQGCPSLRSAASPPLTPPARRERLPLSTAA